MKVCHAQAEWIAQRGPHSNIKPNRLGIVYYKGIICLTA